MAAIATVVGDPSNTMTSPFSTAFSYRSWMPSSFVLEPTNVGEGDRGGDGGGADAGAVAVAVAVGDGGADAGAVAVAVAVAVAAAVAVDAGAGDASSGLDWTMVSLC